MSWLIPPLKAARSIAPVGIIIFVSIACLAQSNDYQPLPETSVIINSQQQKPPEQGSEAQQNTTPANQQNSNPGYSMRLDVPLVTLDVSVLNPDGYFVNELTKENFRVLEDGTPQQITSLAQTRQPVCCVAGGVLG